MSKCRIRLMRVPMRREASVTYPMLLIHVVERSGDRYVVPTLSEAIAHLRSVAGARLELIERLHATSHHEEQKRPFRHEQSAQIVIDRVPGDFALRRLHAGLDATGPTFVEDYSLEPPVELAGRMTMRVVDLPIDRPEPWPEPSLPDL